MFYRKSLNTGDRLHLSMHGGVKYMIKQYFYEPVLRVHKNRHDSKPGQIVFHMCYNITYYMYTDTVKFSTLKWFKFVHRLISMTALSSGTNYSTCFSTLT